MASQQPVVRVGVAAIISDAEGKMLVGVRKGSHGSGTYLLRLLDSPQLFFSFPCLFHRLSRMSRTSSHHVPNSIIYAYTNRLDWATGTLQFPGGHLEVGEDYLECAERETLEETGLKVKAEKDLAFTNDIFDAEKKHYITIFVSCRRDDEQKQPVVSLRQPVVHILEEFVR